MIMKLGMKHYELKPYKVYINDDQVDLDLFYSNFKCCEICFCTHSRLRYQVSVYRAIGPLVCLCKKQVFSRHSSNDVSSGFPTRSDTKASKRLEILNYRNQKDYTSLVMRKPDFCICENKDTDQLRGKREADQRLCFRCIDLLPINEISSL